MKGCDLNNLRFKYFGKIWFVSVAWDLVYEEELVTTVNSTAHTTGLDCSALFELHSVCYNFRDNELSLDPLVHGLTG